MSSPSTTATNPRFRFGPVALGSSAAGALLMVAGWLVFAVYVIQAGTPLSRYVLATLGVLVFQILPGALVWRSFRPRDGWLIEDVAMGFAMGIVVAVPSQTVAGLLHSRIPALVLPVLVAVALLAVPGTRRRIVEARWSPLPWWLGGVVALSSLAAFTSVVGYARTNRLSWTPGPGQPHVDTYLHLALSGEILHRGPVQWPTVQGEDLGYQWFAHAWIAHVTAVTNVGLDHVLMRFMPSILPILCVMAVVACALRLTKDPRVAAVAGALAMLGGVGSPFHRGGLGLPLSPLSPTLGLGVPTLMATIAVLAMRWRGEVPRAAFVMIPLLTVIAAGTKGSTSPVVIAGLALALVAMLVWNRPAAKSVAIDLVTMLVFLGLTMVVVFHGSAAGLKLGMTDAAKQTGLADILHGVPSSGLQRTAVITAVLAGLTRGAFAFALPFSRRHRLDPVSWVLIGASIAGAAAVGVFSHPGRSQGYFLLTAGPVQAVGSAIALAAIGRRYGARTVAVTAGVAAVAGWLFWAGPAAVLGNLGARTYDRVWQTLLLATLVVVVAAVVGMVLVRHRVVGALAAIAATGLGAGVWGVSDGLQAAPLPVPKAVPITAMHAVSNGEIAAARYIRDHSGVDDLVMTNRHCTAPIVPQHCDSRRWVVTAFTERQAFIEGWTATPRATELAPNGRDSVFVDYWHPDLLRLNDTFASAPTAAAAKRLWNYGVRWVYLENDRPHTDLAPYATRRYANRDASAWQLNPPR